MRYSVGLKTHPARWSRKQIASAHVKKRYELARMPTLTARATGVAATRVEPTAATKAGEQEKEKGMARRC